MSFASPWDAALFLSGPPSVFVLDPKGELRADGEHTREAWMLIEERSGVPPEGREEAHYVQRDRATGLEMYMLVTHPDLATHQPNSDATRHADYVSAVERVAAQWTRRPIEGTVQPG